MNPRRTIVAAALTGLCALAAWPLGRSVVVDAPAAETPEPKPATEPAASAAPEATPEATRAGSELPRAPAALEISGAPAPSVDHIRASLEAGDTARALRSATALAQSATDPRERDMASLTEAWLHRARGRYNLASEAFGRVRAGSGPLAAIAAYHEADADWRRGQYGLVVERCEQYRKRWPAGHDATDCLRLLAHSNVSLGRYAAARAQAKAYDDQHETGRITEQIELAIALEIAEERPDEATAIFRALAIEHGAALTGRVSEEQLASLRARGVKGALTPSDPESQMKRALSLRESGRRDAAWEAFEQIGRSKDTRLQAFYKEESERFGWQTQRWPWLVDYFGGEYARTDDPVWSWKRYSALARSGRFGDAADYALQMQKKHPTSRQWKRSQEEVGRTLMLARRYPEARAQFDIAAAQGGASGRRAALSAAFCSYMAGEDKDAIARYGALPLGDPSTEPEIHYWRAKAALRAEDRATADADIRWLTESDPWGWYTALLDPKEPPAGPFARTGRWAGERQEGADLVTELLQRAPLEGVLASEATTFVALPAVVPPKPRGAETAFASFTWGLPKGPSYVDPPLPAVLDDPEQVPPSSYRTSSLWDAEQARAKLAAFSEEYGSKWPELRAVNDLARVGLYDLSGPLLSEWYELWQRAVRSKDATARKLSGTAPEAWRELFLAARDHHNTARSSYAWWETLADRALVLEAYRIGYPLAHDQPVWENAKRYDLDPYLVLGLMRQESTYNSTAKSRVGARGAMQIMPKTGHLLADLVHDTRFDAGDLEDPTVAVAYGIRYLGLLIDRFGGVYPLAVASYNGGPFNVSNWLSGTGLDMPVDAFVEHIPYRETRNYVKKVTSGYSAYIGLYAPKGAALVIPPKPTADRREIVDF